MERPLLLDSYAAKTCLHALHLRVVTDPGDALPVPDVVRRRMERGIDFEQRVGALLEELAPANWRLLRRDRHRDLDEAGWREDRRRRQAETNVALESRTPLIWNPVLQPDLVGHRSGEPDLLRLAPTGRHYLPLDVKAHRLARRGSAARPSFEYPLESLLDDAAPTDLMPLAECGHYEDLLQLSHYVEMLAALGISSGDPHVGAIIGLASDGSGEPVVTWVDLDEAGLRYRSDLTLEPSSGSVLGWYRDSFSDALAVTERAEAIAQGADLPPLSEPWFLDGVCSSCTWRRPCGAEMLAGRHVSLVKPRSVLRPALRAKGVRTIDALAQLDDEELLTNNTWRRAVRNARMALAGEAVPMALFPDLKTRAEPRLWRRPDAPGPWAIQRADVELDVDMENTDDFVYLWGTLLSYRSADLALPGFVSGYRGFGAEFPAMDEGAQCAVFVEFWSYLEELRKACADSGLSFAAFGYNLGAAENRWMTHCAELLDTAEGGSRWRDGVMELRDSGDWRDLLTGVRSRFESLNGLGLKVVAGTLGFHWRDEDPGGGNSMLWYEGAVNHAEPEVRGELQQRLLAYNEDDVTATLFIRDWLTGHEPEALAVLSEADYRVATGAGEVPRKLNVNGL